MTREALARWLHALVDQALETTPLRDGDLDPLDVIENAEKLLTRCCAIDGCPHEGPGNPTCCIDNGYPHGCGPVQESAQGSGLDG